MAEIEIDSAWTDGLYILRGEVNAWQNQRNPLALHYRGCAHQAKVTLPINTKTLKLVCKRPSPDSERETRVRSQRTIQRNAGLETIEHFLS